jgi:hypothetical protein
MFDKFYELIISLNVCVYCCPDFAFMPNGSFVCITPFHILGKGFCWGLYSRVVLHRVDRFLEKKFLGMLHFILIYLIYYVDHIVHFACFALVFFLRSRRENFVLLQLQLCVYLCARVRVWSGDLVCVYV